MSEQVHEESSATGPIADAGADGEAIATVAGDRELRNLCEAALLAAGRPLTVDHLAELFDESERPGHEQIRMALEALAADYEGRGIELREVASGYRIQVRATAAGFVSRLWQERPAKYSRALLETLALIAYRQPITRGEIEDIRGVAVNPNIIRTLQERGWIRTVGYREVPGRPELLGTTREFLDYFGLKTLDNLPTLAQLRDVENLGVQLEFPETQSVATESVATESVATESAAEPVAAGEAQEVADGAPAGDDA